MVTVFCPAMTTGAEEFVTQADGESRLVVDCKVNPTALVDHVKMIPLGGTPEGVMVSCGVNEMLNTVPPPELPPDGAVPYRVFPDKISPAYGFAPSLLVKTPE